MTTFTIPILRTREKNLQECLTILNLSTVNESKSVNTFKIFCHSYSDFPGLSFHINPQTTTTSTGICCWHRSEAQSVMKNNELSPTIMLGGFEYLIPCTHCLGLTNNDSDANVIVKGLLKVILWKGSGYS